MSDFMPGSPYFDERPKGLLTWPILLKVGLPISTFLLILGWKFDILIEILLIACGILIILATIRK